MKNIVTAPTLSFAVTALGIFLSLIGIDDRLVEWFPWVSPYIEQIEVAFIFVVGLFALILFIHLLSQLLSLAGAAKNGELPLLNKGMGKFEPRSVKSDDIPELLKIYAKLTDGNLDEIATKKIYNHCKDGWKKIVNVATSEIVGYFIVLPLTAQGEKAITDGDFNFDDENLLKFFRKRLTRNCCGYIGMVGCIETGMGGKSRTLYELTEFVNSKNFRTIYARAATKDGLRLVKSKSFNPVVPRFGYQIGALYKKSL